MLRRLLEVSFYFAIALSIWFPPVLMTAKADRIDQISYSLPVVFGPQIEVQDITTKAQPAQQIINKILRILDIYWGDIPRTERLKFANFLYQESITYKIDPILILAVIREESDFDPYALSPKGACGLMQLLPDVASEIAKEVGIRMTVAESVFDPYTNVKLGVNYLASLIKQFGDITLALEAYYLGPGAVQLLGIDGLTFSYSSKVLSTYRKMNRS